MISLAPTRKLWTGWRSSRATPSTTRTSKKWSRTNRQDVKDFERQAERGKDPSLKEWAGKTLPTLRKHLREIESISAKVLAMR
jgi:hypothetical protein